MKIKKFLKWIFLITLFIVISISFFRIVSYMQKPSRADLDNIAGFYSEKRNSLDVVCIGGSSTFVYWQPLRAFENNGIASYNYASNSVQPELYKTMVKEILKTQNPELIIVDARAFTYREDFKPTEVHYRNALTGMPLSLNKIEFIHNNVKKNLGENELSYYFDIIKYHRDISKENIDNQVKMAFNEYQHPYKGFYFVPKVEKQQVINNNANKKKTKITEETEEILLDFLNYIKTTNCNYIFVVSPSVELQIYKENYNYMEDIITKYGYKFLDCNDFYEEMKLDFNTDMYHEAHVNIFGSEKYTDFLSKYILQNYKLPDRRAEYKDWVALLPKWNEAVKQTKIEIQKLINEQS